MPDPVPVPPPVIWYQSRVFTALWQNCVLMILIWTLSGLQSGNWDWKAGLAIPIISSVIVAFRDMWSPNIVGIFPMQNRKNLG